MVKLDMDNLRKRIVRTISTEEALKKVPSIKWPQDVIEGRKRVIITEGGPSDDGENAFRVKAAIIDEQIPTD